MSFRNFSLLTRVLAPAGLLLLATSVFVNNDAIATALQVVGAIPFLIAAFCGVFLIKRDGPFLIMACPFCGKQGISQKTTYSVGG